VNATFDLSAPAVPGFAPEPRPRPRIVAGVALSVAVHALLLAVYRQPAAPPLSPPPEPLTVRLRAAPPPPVPVPEIAAPAPQAPARPAPRNRAADRPTRRVIAVEPEARSSPDKTYSVDTAPETPQAPPRFDLDTARAVARNVANEPDPAKAGTALERLPPPALKTEDKFERAIKSAKRRDCKDGVPGGLLAPLFLAMDKKDSGCKW
jgi:hypothetical protein